MTVLKVRFKKLWQSRTHYVGIVLGLLVATQPTLMTWLNYRLTAEDFALAGLVITGVISAMRMITTTDLKDK